MWNSVSVKLHSAEPYYNSLVSSTIHCYMCGKIKVLSCTLQSHTITAWYPPLSTVMSHTKPQSEWGYNTNMFDLITQFFFDNNHTIISSLINPLSCNILRQGFELWRLQLSTKARVDRPIGRLLSSALNTWNPVASVETKRPSQSGHFVFVTQDNALHLSLRSDKSSNKHWKQFHW